LFVAKEAGNGNGILQETISKGNSILQTTVLAYNLIIITIIANGFLFPAIFSRRQQRPRKTISKRSWHVIVNACYGIYPA
jgi:hypothetical protein